MSCPDWGELVAHRFAADGREPIRWERALAHLEGCPECRRRALAADPVLVFQRLPAPDAAPGEVEEVRRAVATLRRARGLDGSHRVRVRAAAWGRGIAAAALLAAAALAGPDPRGQTPLAAGSMTAGTPAAAGQADPRQATASFPAELAGMPVIEELDRPGARVYQLRDGGLSVVMIVDGTLDV